MDVDRYSFDAPTVRAREFEVPVLSHFDLKTTLMDELMVEVAQNQKVRQLGLAPVRPMFDVMPL